MNSTLMKTQTQVVSSVSVPYQPSSLLMTTMEKLPVLQISDHNPKCSTSLTNMVSSSPQLETPLYVHNVDYLSFKEGWFVNTPKKKTVLISICDADKKFHLPKGSQTDDWASTWCFHFDDIGPELNGVDDCYAMTETQGQALSCILDYVVKEKLHVVVHCTAGLCRSGAVAEFLIRHFGYHEVNPARLPNIHVLNTLERLAGKQMTSDDYKVIFDKYDEFEGKFH